ncbi:MAG: ATP-dependent metallopeptidase FtsH/Yme1/Tma family protein, partial [Lachnospiraceae bacterium]|nr:ATP-dependent metallopeptidase FtsH/Yme1/Tma family protein [Lachnospiraceae bacterium]
MAFLVILGIAYYFAKTTVDSRYDYTYEQFIKALDDKEVTAVTIKQNREVPTGQV